MGREIKRVPLDFDWPLEKTWEGFLVPDVFDFPACEACANGDGYSDGLTPEAHAISNTFYPHQIGGENAHSLAWCDKIGQAEVDHLVAHGRLGVFVDGAWTHPPRLAADVNAEQRSGRGLSGHDGINRSILVSFRCAQLGITERCAVCNGNGDIATDEQRAAREAWARTEPPAGEGWQVWETVSDGSPVTPVFATAKDLARHLSTVGDAWHQKTVAEKRWRPDPLPSYESALAFVTAGWAPSMVITAQGTATSYEVKALLEKLG